MLEGLLAQLCERTAQPNWGGDDEKAIPREMWDRAVEIISLSRPLGEPAVAPAGDGAIHLNWWKDGNFLVIEITKSDISWSLIDTDGDGYCGHTQNPRLR